MNDLSMSQPQHQPTQVHPKFKKEYKVFKDFMLQAKDITVEYQCFKCGKQQNTHVFNQRPYSVGRACEHNIDEDIADHCDADEKNCNQINDPPRLYSNWEMEFEYSTPWEVSKNQFMYDVWRKWNVTCDITENQALCMKSRLQTRIKFEELVIKEKIRHFEFNHGINNVNKFVLQGTLRRLRFYLKVIEYYEKVNKYGDCEIKCTEYGKCHACGMDNYLKTQYERSYVGDYARKVMNLVEYHTNKDDEENMFVCGPCVEYCYHRTLECYGHWQPKSLLYYREWSSLKKYQQILFALGHLNNITHPVYIAWYDMVEEEWVNGKVTKVVNPRSYTILVERVKCVHPWDKIQTLCFASRTEEEYFLYQRPSTSMSPLAKFDPLIKKLLIPFRMIIDTTCDDYANYYAPAKMYGENGETINMFWEYPVLRAGKIEVLSFAQLMHTKLLYDSLQKNNFLKQYEFGKFNHDAKRNNSNNSESKPQLSTQ